MADENPEELNSESRAPGKRSIEELDRGQREHEFVDERVKVSAGEDEVLDGNDKEGKGLGGVKTLQRKPTKRAKVVPKKDGRQTKVQGKKITNFFGK